MQLCRFAYFVPLISIISGIPFSKRDTSQDDDWILELESQIINSPKDLQKNVSTSPPAVVLLPIIPSEVQVEIQEPIVVTSKPYLTGEHAHDEDKMSTEKTAFSETESQSTPRGIENEAEDSSTTDTDEDVERVRAILDKILAVRSTPASKQSDSGDEIIGHFNDGSEVRTFVVLLKNQTPMIIFGCILSVVILVALIVSVHHILKKLNENSSITLIAHYEYDEATKAKVEQQVRNEADGKFI